MILGVRRRILGNEEEDTWYPPPGYLVSSSSYQELRSQPLVRKGVRGFRFN
jgi:hypothetical protein